MTAVPFSGLRTVEGNNNLDKKPVIAHVRGPNCFINRTPGTVCRVLCRALLECWLIQEGQPNTASKLASLNPKRGLFRLATDWPFSHILKRHYGFCSCSRLMIDNLPHLTDALSGC